MRAICVDDEYLLLRTLKNVVIQSPDIEQAIAFNDEHDALEWARDNDFDIAFIDIELHDMNGLELAKALHEIRSNARIVFCTGFTNYAVDAISLHMDVGYVMKPIDYEASVAANCQEIFFSVYDCLDVIDLALDGFIVYGFHNISYVHV